MGVVKKSKTKSKEEVKNELKNKKVVNGKNKNVDKNGKVKKKKTVSCLQCIKSHDDGGLEGKYRVAAPELMQDTFMSDSEDEGGEVECPIQQQQQYRYMNSEAGTLHRAKPLEDSVTDGHLWPSNNDRKVATIERQPLDQGFLVSFVVDARGGAMKAKRRGGVRVIVPPAACAAPTRVTCRAATRRAPAAAPPPLMEGEALASRLLELQPQGAKFLAPVIIEVPIYTASCKEREIVILRSDTGETWQDHYLHNNDNPMIQEALNRERQEHGPAGETLGESGERVCRIVTSDFPHYLACVSRVRQEVHIIGPEGGTVSSAHTPQVQALFPAQALTKRIRVGLQAHSAQPDLCKRVLPRHVSVSPVITVEPRRRKFHRSITLTAPLPKQDGKPDKNTQTLRLLCSIMGGQARAVWEDVTGSTPLTVTDDCASFTTTVSARFWLINCQNVSDASKLATELYREMLLVPFDVRIVVLAKRLDALEGRLLVLYITDRYAYETLLQQEHYAEVAHSTAVRFLDAKEIYLEFSGNLVPVTKSGSQPVFNFESFRDNRVEFTVRVKHHEEPPSGRIYFMNEPKVAKGEQSQTPACVLDVELPERVAPRAGKSHTDYLNLDQSGFDALKDELSFHYGEHPSLTPHPPPPVPPAPPVNGHDTIITNGDVKYTTKEEEKDEKEDLPPKPHVNGGAVVDSNKTKATFDSDEDKTPHNTLEKGDKTKKEKREGGFFGGIAGKVKNVFSHSEDKEDDSKESSPKAKGRESKEKSPPPRKEKSPPPRKEKSPPPHKGKEGKDKSPPKAAPRIIDEGLLDKVDDMFKDLKSKPHREEDDIESKVYATKLVVDEDRPHIDTHLDTKEVYEQYANMQPVETPLRVPTKDPFAYDTDEKLCCKGFKGGQKHTHEETSNLVDIIENANFTAQEKLVEVSDKVEGDVKDGIEKLDKEKDNIKQKASEVADDLKNKEQELKSDAQDKLQELKEAAKETADNLKESLGVVRDNVEHKAQVIDFIAQEKAEAAKLNAEQAAAAAKHAAQDIKKDAKNAAENAKSAANETLHDLGESVESTKGKAQDAVNDAKSKAKEVKEEVKSKKEKKKKEGKNFISGFVSNIFGEKDKAEKAVKDKIAESKDAANDLLDQAAAKKDDIEYSAAKKQHELQHEADQLLNSADAKKKELEKAAHDKAAEAQKSIQDKADEAKKAAQEKVEEVKQTANDAKQAVEDKANETKQAALDAKQAVEDKAQETKQALQDTAEQAKQAIHDKKSEVEKAVHDKAEEAKHAAQEKADQAASAIQSKKDELEHAVNEKTEEAKGALQATKDGLVDFGHAVQDKAHETKQAVADKADEAKKAVQDKASDLKEGADNLVQGAKSKTEEVGQAIHDKAYDVKESLKDKKDELADGAKNLLDQAGAKKNEVQEGISKKHEELKEGAESLVHGAQAKVSEAGEAIHNKKEEIAQGIHDKTHEISNAASEKKDEFGRAIHDKKDEAASDLERIRLEAEQTTQQISKSAEDAINAAADKKAELQANLGNKVEDIKKSGKEGLENLQQSASGKVDSLQQQSKDAFALMQESALGSFDKVESAAKDKVSDATDKWEDLQSSTRDTFADFKDDAKSWENSAQDTLHSFQSSAGNTFDSLDDSAREFIGGAQNTAQNVEKSSQELFGDVKKGFEGFQVSADNKLEDVKGATNERLEEAGARLSETAEGVAKNAQETEHAVLDAVSTEADKFTSSLNDLGNSVFGSSGKGFMKDSSTKLLESEKSQASPSPQKKGSGFFAKLRRNH